MRRLARIGFTLHAVAQMEERQVGAAEVQAVPAAPERDGCRAAWGQVDERGIKVVDAVEDGLTVVVTVIPQRRRMKP